MFCQEVSSVLLSDKIREYEKTKKMLNNTPAMYKKEHPFLKEVDSLALANVQLHLEKAYKNFFRDPKIGYSFLYMAGVFFNIFFVFAYSRILSLSI